MNSNWPLFWPYCRFFGFRLFLDFWAFGSISASFLVLPVADDVFEPLRTFSELGMGCDQYEGDGGQRDSLAEQTRPQLEGEVRLLVMSPFCCHC